jgi:tetratricopeptide (TPR) repeat protein
LARPDIFAYTVAVRDLLRPGQTEEYTETMPERLFRRVPQVRFIGRAGPQFLPPLADLAQERGLHIEAAPLTIQRHAYLSRLTPDKLRWVARLQELELRDRPGRLRTLIDYGHTLLLLNDPRGHEVLAAAAERVLPLRDAAQAPLPDVQRLLEYLMTVSPEQSRSRLSAEDARALALRWFPHSPPMLWRNAEHYFQIGQFRAAAVLLEKLLEMGRIGNFERSQAFDPTILAEPTRMNLGVCYLRLGQLEEAEQCFSALKAHPGFRDKAEKNLALARELRERR